MGVARTAVVIDGWQLVALGVSSVLSEHGCATAATTDDPRTGIRLARELRPDLVVVGATARGAVAEAAAHALRLRPRPAVIALVDGTDQVELGQLISHGVDGVLVRSAPGDELGTAVDRIAGGERFVSPVLLSSLVGAMTASPREARPAGPVLTDRERDVLSGLAQGRTNREIAAELFVGVETVKSHLARLYVKLEARDRRDAVARALAAGLLGSG